MHKVVNAQCNIKTELGNVVMQNGSIHTIQLCVLSELNGRECDTDTSMCIMWPARGIYPHEPPRANKRHDLTLINSSLRLLLLEATVSVSAIAITCCMSN